MTEPFGINDLVQIARARIETRAATDLLASRLGNTSGIVQCVRGVASLLNELYDEHTTHEQKLAIAALFRPNPQPETS